MKIKPDETCNKSALEEGQQVCKSSRREAPMVNTKGIELEAQRTRLDS